MTTLQTSPVGVSLDVLLDVFPYLIAGTMVLVAIGSLVAALWLLRRRRGLRTRQLIYGAVDSLVTPTEREFFTVLLEAVEGDWHVFSKVRLIDVIEVRRGVSERQAHFNRIVAKHVDFVLCDRGEIRPVLVIELDGSSHDRRDRRERDAFVDRALEDAGIAILHVRVARQYSPSELRAEMEARLPARPAVAS